MTPWAPIAIALLAAIGVGWIVSRFSRNAALGVSAGLLVVALALFAFAQIATVAYGPAGLLMIIALGGFVAAWLGRGQQPPRTR